MPGSERGGCRGQRRMDAGVREGQMGSERDAWGQRGIDGVRVGQMGSERDGRWGQRGTDGVREGQMGSERDGWGQRGTDIGVRKGWTQESWVIIFVQKRA